MLYNLDFKIFNEVLLEVLVDRMRKEVNLEHLDLAFAYYDLQQLLFSEGMKELLESLYNSGK